MEFHVYDTRLVRKYARFLEIAYSEKTGKLADDKKALLADTIERMSEEIFNVFARNTDAFWEETYRRAQEMLAAEHQGRLNAAAAQRKREEQRKREREEAQMALDMALA